MTSAKKQIRRYTRHALHNALQLAAAGIHVFPIGLRPGEKTEQGRRLEKVYYKGLQWSKEATTKPKRIRRLWRAYPDSAIGVATGPSRIAVIDRDDLTVDLGVLPEAFSYATPRGGMHHWYPLPQGIEVKSVQPIDDVDGNVYHDVDRKAYGGMVVAYLDKPLAAPPAMPHELPARWAVPREQQRHTGSSSHTPADIALLLDDLDTGDYDERLADLVHAIPREHLSNGDMLNFFGPLVRAAWSAPGGRTAIDDAVDRYADGYAPKYRRAAWHSITTAARDHLAELSARVTFDDHAPATKKTAAKDTKKKPKKKPAKPKKKPTPTPPATYPPDKKKRTKKGKKKANGKAGKRAATEHEEYEPTGRTGVISAPDEPLEVAHEVLAGKALPPLVHYRDGWIMYADHRWQAVTHATVEDVLYSALRDAAWIKYGTTPKTMPWSPTIGRVREVMRAIQSIVTLPASTALPTWLDDRDEPGHLVPTRNGLLDPRTGAMRPRSRHYLSLNFIDADVAEDAPKPKRWLRFIEEGLGDDPGAHALLQEWMGYVIAGDTRRHKGLIMTGKARSGKGTILRVCEALVGGEQGAAATSLSGLAEPFGLEKIENKSLLTLGDLRGTGRESASAAQKLLEIIGGDSVYINRKGRPATTAKIPARVMIAGNTIPRFYDDTAVIASRFVILRFVNSFLGREDLDLEKTLMKELGGIVAWALEGYQRLERRNRFSEPATEHEDRQQLRTNASPVIEFVDDACITTDGVGAPRADVWMAYLAWAAEAGTAPMDQHAFNASLAAAGYTPHRPRVGDDRGKWRFRGLELRSAESASDRARRLWSAVDPKSAQRGAPVEKS